MSWNCHQRVRNMGISVLLLVASFCAPICSAAATQDAALEYKVKAGYLFNFARFVEWPSQALPLPNAPLVVGVLDAGEALAVMHSVLDGKKLDGHPLQIKAVMPDQIGRDLHILFVTRAAGKPPETVKAALAGAPTLLVGETDQFAEHGGMVGFLYEKGSIKFTLNLQQATEVGLKISAKLSSVAKPVRSK